MSSRRFRVVFDQAALEEDLAQAPEAQRRIGRAAADRLAREGITSDQAWVCGEDQRDGKSLPGCVKTYLPWPDGRCGMVLELRVDDEGRFCSASPSASAIHHANPVARASTKSPTADCTTRDPEGPAAPGPGPTNHAETSG